jgi:hypothetical protein
MNGRFLFSLVLLMLVASCSGQNKNILPEINHICDNIESSSQSPVFFPSGRWQFVHTISFHLAKGGAGTAIGVLVLDNKKIHCVLMTIEGLSLFEARSVEGQPIEIIRAVPPFDDQEFAAGLMGDVRTIFQKPPGEAEGACLANGTSVFRYSAAGQVIDILPRQDGCWTMHTYSEQVIARTIQTNSCRMVNSTVIPENINLVAYGLTGYTLDMHLISVEKL